MAKRAKAQAKKPESKPPRPMVLGVRYCMACGRSLIAVAFQIDRTITAGDVGRAWSPCCKAFTAFLLLPTAEGVDTNAPGELPELRKLRGPKMERAGK